MNGRLGFFVLLFTYMLRMEPPPLRDVLHPILHPPPGQASGTLRDGLRIAFWLLLAVVLIVGVILPYAAPQVLPLVTSRLAAEASAYPPGTRLRDCRDAGCPWLIVVPAGTFMMGSPAGEKGRSRDEGPQRPVVIDRAFVVMETEVTRGQFARFAAETKYQRDERCKWDDPGFSQTDEHPVVCVSWNDATAFAAWLSLRTGEAYRLLSEAEWEYVVRAGMTTRFAFGDDDASVCANAQLSCEGLGSAGGTIAGKSFKVNAFGLYDLHGNAWEWVQDCWHDDYTGGPVDGSAWEMGCSGNSRVLRGGGWSGTPDIGRSADRDRVDPDLRSIGIGFRLSRTLSPSTFTL